MNRDNLEEVTHYVSTRNISTETQGKNGWFNEFIFKAV